MAYNALALDEHDDGMSDVSSRPASPSLAAQHGASPHFKPLPTDHDPLGSASATLFMAQGGISTGNENTLSGVGSRLQSILSKHTDPNYNILEGDDYAHDAQSSSSPVLSQPKGRRPSELAVRRVRPSTANAEPSPPADASQTDTTQSRTNSIVTPLAFPQPMRTASSRSHTKMRHPTPDLQTLQGAYIANVAHLEETAEKLSMTSSIEDAIRQMHQEQKRADSRKSSLLSTSMDAPLSRQLSNVNTSIMDTNNTARSGGYSPGGFNMASPRHSISGSRARSSSKGSRLGRTEPDMEGRPLDNFILPSLPSNSPIMSRSASIAEQEEESYTMTKAFVDPIYGIAMPGRSAPQPSAVPQETSPDERPSTSASANTFEQAQEMFQDFDGEHYTPGARGDNIGSRRDISGTSRPGMIDFAPDVKGGEGGERARNISGGSRPGAGDRRVSSQPGINNRVSMARPTTYADPTTGQQMVLYPAPVPMMLNLPQKLSKRPSSTVIEKRRTQALSTLPPAARQSAVWLPDVLEDETGESLEDDHPAHSQEYMAQHQRQTMGGRRTTTDLSHMPPQLRATAYFDQPSISEIVAVKEESAVATLDSILDASAYAPVNAFTDHAYAGRLGAEVYGASKNKRVSSMGDRRSSSTMLLSGRRSSSGNLLDEDGNEKRRSTMSTMLGFKKFESTKDMTDENIPGIGMQPREYAVADEEESDPEMDGQFDDEVYQGPPTTLLAELQLRKQQQKKRVKPALSASGMHTTFMEREAVAAVEYRNRKKGRVNLAWEDPNQIALETQLSDDEDVPLAVLYQSAREKKNAVFDSMRPMGLLEMKDMEDNEPLSRRRDRLTGRPSQSRQDMRASTMTHLLGHPAESVTDVNETLAERVARLKAAGGTATGLLGSGATLRPVSGDFASEMMSQLGIEDTNESKRDSKGKGKEIEGATTPVAEEEETLGQRRKRLQAEKEARQREVSSGGGPKPPAQPANDLPRPALATRRSMADILQAHPAANGSRSVSQGNRVGSNGLLGMHEQQKAQRASTMIGLGAEAATSRDIAKPQREHAHRVYSGQQAYPEQQQQQQSQPMAYGVPGGNLGNYNQQQLMMPNVYGQQQSQFGSQFGFNPAAAGHMSHYGAPAPHAQPAAYGQPLGGLYAGGLYGANNPMAQSMLQLQMQMDQMSSVIAERQLNMGQGRVDMVERWREGVLQ